MSAGDVVAFVGSTGDSTGDHLHLEVNDKMCIRDRYGAVPTPGDMELLARQIETFCALYEQDPRQEMCGMGY